MAQRTIYCGLVSEQQLEQTVTLKVWVQKRGLRAKPSIPLDNSVSSSDLNTFDVYFFQIGRT